MKTDVHHGNLTKRSAVAVIFLVVLIELVFILSGRAGGKGVIGTLEAKAKAVVDTCAGSSYHPTCYDAEIPKQTADVSMEDAFRVTKMVQGKDTSYAYCHVLGHALSARETKKDKSKWKEVITRCPSGVCSNGCIHGAFQERFRADALPDDQIAAVIPELKMVCEPRGAWNPTHIEQASCYHAVGHLLMYITNANAARSTEICDTVGHQNEGNDFRQVCYDGVFMQIFQPLEPEDFALVKGKQPGKNEHRAFCNNFTGKKRGSCISEGWPLYQAELTKPGEIERLCSLEEPSEEDRCFTAVMYALVVQFRFELPTIRNFCKGLSPSRQGRCIANTASRLIETDYDNIDTAVAWCRDGAQYDKNGECFQELSDYASRNFHRESPEFFRVCRALPDAWKVTCLTPTKPQ